MTLNIAPTPWHTGGRNNLIVYSADGWPVANASVFHHRHQGLETAQSHAALIAEAPAMVEVLQACIEAYEMHRDGQPTGHLWPDPNQIFRARCLLKRLGVST